MHTKLPQPQPQECVWVLIILVSDNRGECYVIAYMLVCCLFSGRCMYALFNRVISRAVIVIESMM